MALTLEQMTTSLVIQQIQVVFVLFMLVQLTTIMNMFLHHLNHAFVPHLLELGTGWKVLVFLILIRTSNYSSLMWLVPFSWIFTNCGSIHIFGKKDLVWGCIWSFSRWLGTIHLMKVRFFVSARFLPLGNSEEVTYLDHMSSWTSHSSDLIHTVSIHSLNRF